MSAETDQNSLAQWESKVGERAIAEEAEIRAIVVDELCTLGVVSEKKARRRIMKLAEAMPPLK